MSLAKARFDLTWPVTYRHQIRPRRGTDITMSDCWTLVHRGLPGASGILPVPCLWTIHYSACCSVIQWVRLDAWHVAVPGLTLQFISQHPIPDLKYFACMYATCMCGGHPVILGMDGKEFTTHGRNNPRSRRQLSLGAVPVYYKSRKADIKLYFTSVGTKVLLC